MPRGDLLAGRACIFSTYRPSGRRTVKSSRTQSTVELYGPLNSPLSTGAQVIHRRRSQD